MGVKFPRKGGGFSPKTYQYKSPASERLSVGMWCVVIVAGEEKVVKIHETHKFPQSSATKTVVRVATSSEVLNTKIKNNM